MEVQFVLHAVLVVPNPITVMDTLYHHFLPVGSILFLNIPAAYEIVFINV